MKNQSEKIVIGVDARPLVYGITGNSRYLAEVLRNLVQKENLFFILYSNKTLSPIFGDIFAHANVRVEASSGGPGLFWLNFKLPRLLQRDQVDVFWGTLQMLPVRPLSVPSVVNYHDLNFISSPETMSYANYLQHRFLSSFSLQNAQRIFCLSKNTRNDIMNYNPDLEKKLVVVYPGVRKTKTTGKYSWKKYIFTVGTLEPRKNIGTIVKAWLLLKEENPDFNIPLIIAGRRGWKEERLTASLMNGSLEEKGIVFIENPEDDLLNYLYKNCLLFLFPSVHEGFGLPLLEALQENKVCVASNIPVFHEILEDDIDFFVPPVDAVAWKNAILNAFKKRKRKRVWKSSRWSWEKTATKIFDELIKVAQVKR